VVAAVSQKLVLVVIIVLYVVVGGSSSISGHRPPTNYGSTGEQEPSIEEAIS
jgi:hypothetical protein